MAHAFKWGKLSKCHFKGKTNRKWVNGLKIYDSEKFWTLGAGLSPPRGNIHVYYQNIQRPPSLKPLGQSKPNVRLSIPIVYMNGPGHITKMVAMAITSKNL